jgi:hypothetical protein
MVSDALPADFANLRPQEELAPGQAQILDAAEGAREFENFPCRQVVSPVEMAPVKAVLAFHVGPVRAKLP